MRNLLTKNLREFLGGTIQLTGFNLVYLHQDQQLDIENSSDVKDIGPNHIQYLKVTRNDNC